MREYRARKRAILDAGVPGEEEVRPVPKPVRNHGAKVEVDTAWLIQKMSQHQRDRILDRINAKQRTRDG